MGYNTDWNGSLKTSRPFTRLELNAWNEMANERHDSKHNYGSPYREFPSIWCDFNIRNNKNYENVKGGTFFGSDYGVFEWNESEKTYEGIGWIKHFIKFLIECSKENPIYAEGIMYWQGDDSEDTGYVSVDKNRIRTFEGTIEYHEVACEYILQPTDV